MKEKASLLCRNCGKGSLKDRGRVTRGPRFARATLAVRAAWLADRGLHLCAAFVSAPAIGGPLGQVFYLAVVGAGDSNGADT